MNAPPRSDQEVFWLFLCAALLPRNPRVDKCWLSRLDRWFLPAQARILGVFPATQLKEALHCSSPPLQTASYGHKVRRLRPSLAPIPVEMVGGSKAASPP